MVIARIDRTECPRRNGSGSGSLKWAMPRKVPAAVHSANKGQRAVAAQLHAEATVHFTDR